MNHEYIAEWLKDVESILLCSHCSKVPKGSIFFCKYGHHVCEICYQWKICVVCSTEFQEFRSHQLEHLCHKFNDLKVNLSRTSHLENQLPITGALKPFNNATKTSDATEHKSSVSKNPVQLNLNNSTSSKGKKAREIKNVIVINENLQRNIDTHHNRNSEIRYHCRVRLCSEKLPLLELLKHIRKTHIFCLQEFRLRNWQWSEKTHHFKLPYRKSTTFEQIIVLPHMKIFFLNIQIDEHGDLAIRLEIAITSAVARGYTFDFEIFDWAENYQPISNAEIHSCAEVADETIRNCFIKRPSRVTEDLSFLRSYVVIKRKSEIV